MLDDFTLNLVNSLNEGVYLVDTERVITFWNKAAERLTGFSAAEVVGRSCSDNILRHVNDAGCELCLGCCPLARSMEEGVAGSAKAYLHHKTGSRLPVSIKLVPFFDQAHRVVGAAEHLGKIEIEFAEKGIDAFAFAGAWHGVFGLQLPLQGSGIERPAHQAFCAFAAIDDIEFSGDLQQFGEHFDQIGAFD